MVIVIESKGGVLVRTRGSHQRFQVTYTDPDGVERTASTTVQGPRGREIPRGTLAAIERDMMPAFGKGWLIR